VPKTRAIGGIGAGSRLTTTLRWIAAGSSTFHVHNAGSDERRVRTSVDISPWCVEFPEVPRPTDMRASRQHRLSPAAASQPRRRPHFVRSCRTSGIYQSARKLLLERRPTILRRRRRPVMLVRRRGNATTIPSCFGRSRGWLCFFFVVVGNTHHQQQLCRHTIIIACRLVVLLLPSAIIDYGGGIVHHSSVFHQHHLAHHDFRATTPSSCGKEFSKKAATHQASSTPASSSTSRNQTY